MQARRAKRYNDINTTPMVDLMLVLMVIFIFMAMAEVKGIKVNLPKAQTSVSLQANQTKAITVSKDGQIYYEAYPVSMQELDLKLTEQKALTPDFPIVVKGDGDVAYKRIVLVLDLLRRLDLSKFGLITGNQQKTS